MVKTINPHRWEEPDLPVGDTGEDIPDLGPGLRRAFPELVEAESRARRTRAWVGFAGVLCVVLTVTAMIGVS
jgi:hypothetical protein